MDKTTIGFIGGGNMARSLIGGLRASRVEAERIQAADPGSATRAALQQDFGIQVQSDNQAIVDQCDVVVFAVKPQVLQQVARALRPAGGRKQLFLTIAAGIRTASLQDWLGEHTAIVRAMPNTPAMVQSGATGLFANRQVTAEQHALAESIMRAVGLTVWVEEETQMDAVTALSGSGPAYFFLVMEVMEQAAVRLGLPPETARLLTIQTAFGAAKLALEVEEEPALLRENVTSPGGTTEQALLRLREGGIADLFAEALQAAYDRANELADQLGQ